MTGPIRQSTGERAQDSFVESPTRANKTAVEVYIGGSAVSLGGGGGATNLTTQTLAFTILSGQENTWQLAPTTGLLNIFNVEVYDSTNSFRVFVDWRISSSNILEIKSASAQTYTIRIIGAN